MECTDRTRIRRDVRYYELAKEKTFCACGREKESGVAFCRRCTGRLPRDLQFALARFYIGAGWEEGYEAAAEYLGNRRHIR